MAQIVECLANKCKYWQDYRCINKAGIRIDGNGKCRNFELKEEYRKNKQ